MKTRGALALAALALAAACVPATDPREARGAAGVRLAPSPETTGAPFTTDDGWTVTIDALYLRLWVSAQSADENEPGLGEEWTVDARSPVEPFTRAVLAGPARLSFGIQPGFVGTISSDDTTHALGVPPDVAARLSRPEEAVSLVEDLSSPQTSPTVLVLATAEKGGRRVRLDAAFSTSGQSPELSITVVRDALTLLPLPVRGETLFDFAQDGRRLFGPLAEADTSQDGVVTTTELSAKRWTCETETPSGEVPDPRCLRTLVDMLRLAAPALVGGTAGVLAVAPDAPGAQAPDANP